MRVRYSHDGPVLLGTGGALRRAVPLLGEAFFIVYGDSYLDCDYRSVLHAFEASRKPALMTVFRNDNLFDRSNVVFSDGIIERYDKQHTSPDMHHIDWGLGVMRSALLSEYAEGETFDLATLYQAALRRGELAGFEVYNRFYEIGSTSGIEETERFLSNLLETG